MFSRKKKEDSILEVLLRNSDNGILNVIKTEEKLNPQSDGVRFSSGFKDNFSGNDDPEEVSDKVIEILKNIYNGNLKNSKQLEKKLIELNFTTLRFIDKLHEKIDRENYCGKTYDIFKEVLYSTSNHEVFKLAIEITGLSNRYSELLSEYKIIAQYEEFSRYACFVLLMWRENKEVLDSLLKILNINSDWGAINFAEMLMNQKDIMKSIDNQGRILIGALKNNCIHMEIAYDLAERLDIVKLIDRAPGDNELFDGILDLFYTLYFDRQPCGGLLDLANQKELLIKFISLLVSDGNDCRRLLGLRYTIDFIEESNNKAELIEVFTEKEFNKACEEVYLAWNSLYSEDKIIECIKNKVGAFTWFTYVKENKLIKVVAYLETLYFNPLEKYYNLEEVLISLGSEQFKEKTFEEFKVIYDVQERRKHQYSYINVFGEDFKSGRDIINKAKICGEFINSESLDIISNLLEDFDPAVRSEAISILYAFNESIIKEKEELLNGIFNRLSDSPYYVRSSALELCINKNIKISNFQFNEIINELEKRERGDEENFKEELIEIVLIS